MLSICRNLWDSTLDTAVAAIQENEFVTGLWAFASEECGLDAPRQVLRETRVGERKSAGFKQTSDSPAKTGIHASEIGLKMQSLGSLSMIFALVSAKLGAGRLRS